MVKGAGTPQFRLPSAFFSQWLDEMPGSCPWLAAGIAEGAPRTDTTKLRLPLTKPSSRSPRGRSGG